MRCTNLTVRKVYFRRYKGDEFNGNKIAIPINGKTRLPEVLDMSYWQPSKKESGRTLTAVETAMLKKPSSCKYYDFRHYQPFTKVSQRYVLTEKPTPKRPKAGETYTYKFEP